MTPLHLNLKTGTSSDSSTKRIEMKATKYFQELSETMKKTVDDVSRDEEFKKIVPLIGQTDNKLSNKMNESNKHKFHKLSST